MAALESLITDAEKELNRITRISNRQAKKVDLQLDSLLCMLTRGINSTRSSLRH